MRVKSVISTKKEEKEYLKKQKVILVVNICYLKLLKSKLLEVKDTVIDLKKLKSNYRTLLIERINAACRNNNIKYSNFMFLLKKNNNIINHKMLSEMAINDPKTFSILINKLKNN